ncbi:MAG TPA: YqgE/AlgH family protein [Mycobacteriales bacterium]|nr:YqgE/AlgH family protein [Mycobacteriales bacterium]
MDGTSLRGALLVSTPGLRDPNFDRTVVLVLEHDENGSLGLILNRPSATPVGEVLPSWHDLTSEPSVVFSGGPVDGSAAICLGSTRPGISARAAVQPINPTLGVVDLDSDPALLAGGVAYVRVFAGYSGWGGGQLEAEIEAGGWFVVDGLPGDPFTAAPLALWRTVLRRQGGRLALFSTYPDDPVHN